MDFQGRVPLLRERHALLPPGDGGGGLHRRPEHHGHARGNAAQNPAVVVGAGFHRIAVHIIGVVVGAAGEPGRREAQAELDAPDGRNAEDHLGNAVFHAAEHGVAPARRDAHGRALDDAAQGIQVRLGRQNGRFHLVPGLVPEHREGLSEQGLQLGRVHPGQIKPAVVHAADGLDMGRDGDAQLLQQLEGDAPGDAQGGRQPSGEVTAAGHILVAAVLHLGRVVGVARAGAVPEIGIVAGPGVGVADDGRHGRAAGPALHQARDELRRVGLLPGGGDPALARSPAVEKLLKPVQIHGDPGGESLHGHADGRGVGLAENRQAKPFAVGAAHRSFPPSA